ncbi:ORF58f (chloroplast) [Artemisia annua]|uniref:ORF58f n=1 Tax=Artemisia annua TaxID=35608 RepID=A0A2U1QFV9_ARTAN|nr:ORF58f [Artemisia annua]
MDRTVSRRSEPSSRTALMGEQPNPWNILQPQVAKSRHRGAKRSEILSGSERTARLIFKTLALMKRQADRKLCYLEHLSPFPSSVP